LQGQIAIFREEPTKKAEMELAENKLIQPDYNNEDLSLSREKTPSRLLRGGFLLGAVPGLPSYIITPAATASIRVTWKNNPMKTYLPTNITRVKAVDEVAIENKIIEIWSCWLLDHIEDIEKHGLGCLEIRGRQTLDLSWLERYNAWEVFRLIKIMWQAMSKNSFERVPLWMLGEVDKCYIGMFKTIYHWVLLELILPRVSDIEMGSEGSYFVRKPKEQWQKILVECKDFVSNPVRWNHFAFYSEEINELFYYSYAGTEHFNNRYEKEISAVLSTQELNRLIPVFRSLLHAKQFHSQVKISISDMSLFEKLSIFKEKLTIGSLYGRWGLSELLRGL
ncbi:MAG TPA: hypothetical protein VNX68_16285, partial [Nitrosopumilaceae archaeon]|nr:hypothetical protein [Nitrosopumilaceae archaeon]